MTTRDHPDAVEVAHHRVKRFATSCGQLFHALGTKPFTAFWQSEASGTPPQLDSIYSIEKMTVAYHRAAAQSMSATASLNALYYNAWISAWVNLLTGKLPEDVATTASFKQIIDAWLKQTNHAVLELQNSPQFLELQRKTLNSQTNARVKQRELTEFYQEQMQMPTLSDVDDLSLAIYELQREVHTLKRQLAQAAPAQHAAPEHETALPDTAPDKASQ